MSRIRLLPICVLLGLMFPGGAAARDVWTIATPVEPVSAVVGAGDGGFLALAGSGSATAVLRVPPAGAVTTLARLRRSCTQLAPAPDGAVLVACGDAELLRVGPDGRVAPQPVGWPAPVRYVDALAPAADGVLVALTDALGGHPVVQIGADGATRQVLAAAGEVRSLASDGAATVFAEETSDAGILIRRAAADGTVATLAGDGAVSISGLAVDVNLAVLPSRDVLLAATFMQRGREVERLVRIDPVLRTLRVVVTPGSGQGFNFGDGGPVAAASLRLGPVAAGPDGDIALVDAAHGQLRWLGEPHAPRLAVAIVRTSRIAPSVTVRATRRARITITVVRRGRTVWRGSATALRATRRIGTLPTGRYTIRAKARDGRGGRAADTVPLVVGRNPTSGPDCTRISALRVDCLHPEASLNDDRFGYVVMLRRDGQLWSASVDPRSKPGAPIPKETPWHWLD